MATQPTFSIRLGGYERVTRELTFADATGAYDALLNPGGYGGPNAERADFGLFLLGQRRETRQRVTLPSADNDPLAVAEFRLLPGQDGWVQATAYAVPVGDCTVDPDPASPLPVPVVIPPAPVAALSPLRATPAPLPFQVAEVPLPEFIYDPSTGGLYRRVCFLDAQHLTQTHWRLAAPVELLDSAYLVSTINELVAVDVVVLRARLNQACILLDFDLTPDQFLEPQGDLIRKRFRQVRCKLEGAAYQWRLGNYYVSQQNLEDIASLGAEALVTPAR